MNTNRPSDANPPNVIQFFGFESADRVVTLFGREAPPTMPQHVSRSFKQCERVLSSRMNKKNTNRPSQQIPPKVIHLFDFESDDRVVTLFGREAPTAMPQHVSRSLKQCERVLSSRMNTNRPSDANPPKVIQFFGFESDDHGVTLSGREVPPAMPQHLSRAADSGNAPGELAST